MTILLVGAGPRLAWARSFLESARAQGPTGAVPEIRVVEGPPTRELLVSLAGETIDVLILLDHGPFIVCPPPGALAPGEAVRNEGLRAVFALEVARRAAQTLILSEGDAQGWATSLASVFAAPPPAELPGPCPPPAEAGGAISTPLSSAYLEPLFAAAGRHAPLLLAWPREAFLDGDAPGDTLPATVEVAGRARILAYGPYLPLPSGSWHATATLGFSPDIGKLPFILEADTGGAVARGFFEVERGGIFSLGLDFQVADAMHPVELRLISQDSALEGQLALIEIELEHSPS
jgi:hypothetical protein